MDFSGFSVVMNSSASSKWAAAMCSESIAPTPDRSAKVPLVKAVLRLLLVEQRLRRQLKPDERAAQENAVRIVQNP